MHNDDFKGMVQGLTEAAAHARGEEVPGIRVHTPDDPTSLSPLHTADPAALTTLFEADPATLSDAQFTTLILEIRRRRNAFTAEEAAKASKAKPTRTKPLPSTTEAALAADKPAGEVNLEDLI